MPTAIVSSVKHPDGIYLTAGQWTRIELSPRFESPSLVFPSSFLSFLSFLLSLHQLLPPSSDPASPKVLSAPLPLLLISRTTGEGAVLCKTCA